MKKNKKFRFWELTEWLTQAFSKTFKKNWLVHKWISRSCWLIKSGTKRCMTTVWKTTIHWKLRHSSTFRASKPSENHNWIPNKTQTCKAMFWKARTTIITTITNSRKFRESVTTATPWLSQKWENKNKIITTSLRWKNF